ncbi:SMP-30/gluconolactonase/LRE family protein [Palleronia rufa]|uniref:SMP-30/gluconolactonase/LRE family protein n=1 Tax=Palleronia rufa TaxID=1530186 RepID=UPI00056B3731|nr:SMP-30/gluconolactonase/LRE family protein [Palleronia rufa]
MTGVEIHDTTRCLLGEGALWHPERQQLFWCDILSNRVLAREDGKLRDWTFDTQVSCLGWVDYDRLLVASARALLLLDLATGRHEALCDLERDRPDTRSNDGRADPFGGFWVGTMGLAKTAGAGAIYRYYKGQLRRIVAEVSIPNAICFAPDGSTAYYTDTPQQTIQRLRLDGDGWPVGEAAIAVDLRGSDHLADGAICDAEGTIWTAQWGSGRVAGYTPMGDFAAAVDLPARQVTCPALGGADLSTLYCTSATVGLPEEVLTAESGHGRTFRVGGMARGQREHRVSP